MRLTQMLLLLLFFTGCASVKKIKVPVEEKGLQISSLKFLDEYIIPYNLGFQDTWVGGLSGIDYDKQKNCYYVISDERSATSAARFYKIAIDIKNYKIDSLRFFSVHNLRNANNDTFPSLKTNPEHAADPESIRYNASKGSLVWSSEGDKNLRLEKMVYQHPWIYEMSLHGKYLDSFFIPENLHIKTEDAGARNNSVLEGLSFTPDYKYLWASMEGPIYEDGPLASPDYANAPVRFTKFDTYTKKSVAQYGYWIDAVAHEPANKDDFNVNGISEILYIGNNRFLVLERSFSRGIPGCVIKIYLADFSKATDVSRVKSLYGNTSYIPASKRLILNLDDLKKYIDNVEGITLGPLLPNGHQSLILIADNNFNITEPAQVLLFEIIP